MNQFVQIPCSKCGTVVWISPAVGSGICPSCHTQTSMQGGASPAPPAQPYGAPPAAPGQPYGAPPAGGAFGAPPGAPPGGPGGYGQPAWGAGPGAPAPGFGAPGVQPVMPPQVVIPTMGRTMGNVAGTMRLVRFGISVVVLLIVAGVGAASFGWRHFMGEPGREKLSNVGIDKKKADPDRMIIAARAYAQKWKSDAGFWSVNILKLGADGTVDLSDSNVVVEYFSPSAVSSPSTTVRNDSIKKFNYIGDDMQYGDKWGVTKRYDPPPRPTMIPTCTAKMLAAKLVAVGVMKPGGTAHAQIDPAFGDEWLVQSSSGPRRFDIANCNERK